MAQKHLSEQAKLEIKKLSLQRISPAELAKLFDISTSTVHHVKKKFEKQGVKFPSLRGQRPNGAVNNLKEKTPAVSTLSLGSPDVIHTENETLDNSGPPEQFEVGRKTINLTLNGVFLQIEAGAIVIVQKDHIDIAF